MPYMNLADICQAVKTEKEGGIVIPREYTLEQIQEAAESAGLSKYVITVCYNEQTLWRSKQKAWVYFHKAARACEGSEAERYHSICYDLEDGKKICYDD